VKFFLATIGDQPWHATCLEEWHALADADSVERHTVTATPEVADRVLFVDLHQHPHDAFLRGLRRHVLVRQFPDKVLVYDQRDRPVRLLSGMYVGGMSQWQSSNVVGGPYPYLHNRSIAALDAEPDLLWSFCGARTHPVRAAVLALPTVDAEIRDTTSLSMFTGNLDSFELTTAQDTYAQLLARSNYVLCPRGHGPSSFRLFETLAAGRVPVIISDSWLPPPGIDWDQCSLRVAQKDVHQIPALLRAQRRTDWRRMQSAAMESWRDHFALQRLWDYIADSLVGLDARRVHPLWWLTPHALRLRIAHGRASLRRVRAANSPKVAG